MALFHTEIESKFFREKESWVPTKTELSMPWFECVIDKCAAVNISVTSVQDLYSRMLCWRGSY